MARKEFKIQIMATPTSANTAIHILAMPGILSSITPNLTIRAKAMFCRAMEMVRRAIFSALGRPYRSSFRSTRSLASTAASEPTPPIATPTWAIASTGASLTPSPTKATCFPLSSMA